MFSVLTEAEKIKVLEAVAKRKYASIEAERVSRAERKKNKEGKPRKPPCECSEFNKNNLPRTIQITLGTGIERTIVTRSVPPKNPRYIPPPFPLGHCSCFTNNRSDDEDSSPPPEKKMSLQEAREEILKDVLSLSSMNAEQTTSEEGAKRFKAAVDNILESNNPYLQLFVDKFLEGKINRSGLQNGHKPIEVVCFVKNRRTEKKMCLVLLLTNKNELEGCITEYEEMVTFFPEVVKRCLRRCRRQKIFKPRIIPPRSPSTSTPPSSSSSLSPSPHLSSSPAPLDSSGSPTTSVLPSASTSAPPQTLASSHTSTSSEV